MTDPASPSRILLIEDDVSLRALLLQVLAIDQYDVVPAADGREAMTLAAQQPFDLVITDLIMPHKEGIETIMELRRKHPGTRIIAMSGGGVGSGQDYLTLAGKLGASRLLAKPFGLDVFSAAVREVLAGS
jgi:DNA-binding response OmpR family regulator